MLHFRPFRQGSESAGVLQPPRCPRNHKFDLKLSECVQCQLCKNGQYLHPFSCQCKCLKKTTCSSGQTFDTNSCRCVSRANVCSTLCPSIMVLDPIACACSCPQSLRCNSRQSLRTDTCECVCNSVLPAPERTRPKPAGSKTAPKTKIMATPKTKIMATPKKAKNKPDAVISSVAKGPIHDIAAPKAVIPNKPRREIARGELWKRKPRHITRSDTRGSRKTHSRSRSHTSATHATGRPLPFGGGACPAGQLLNTAKCQCEYA